LSPDLTVFNSVYKWVKHVQMLGLSLIVSLILAYNSDVFPDTQMGAGGACSEVVTASLYPQCWIDNYHLIILMTLSNIIHVSILYGSL
jgi:hypothetical protein